MKKATWPSLFCQTITKESTFLLNCKITTHSKYEVCTAAIGYLLNPGNLSLHSDCLIMP